MALDLASSRALVTGASGGIGEAIARALHARGATVLVTARREEVLERLAGELGDRVEVIAADLAEAGDVQALPRPGRARRRDGGQRGAARVRAVRRVQRHEVDRALDVNLRAPIHLARAFADQMVERGSGHLVFISSLSGKTASPGGSLYSATKFGMRGFALGLREDLVGTGVGVTTVFPGFIRDAGMFHESRHRAAEGRRHAHARNRWRRRDPRNRSRQARGGRGAAGPAAGLDRGGIAPGAVGAATAQAGQPRRGGADGQGPGEQALSAL